MTKRRAPRRPSTIGKHSLLIAGHATSVSLEDAFWSGLRVIAAARGTTVAALVAEVDSGRDSANLSSAIRVFVLDTYRDGALGTVSSGPLR